MAPLRLGAGRGRPVRSHSLAKAFNAICTHHTAIEGPSTGWNTDPWIAQQLLLRHIFN
ncbi:hypothetical protein BC834DRAFT_887573 [Gloeopeniophorella convolvens]|nr:hypothetical protein BC834DRAFT_887573 [Gloeopeniophorella convolvens]